MSAIASPARIAGEPIVVQLLGEFDVRIGGHRIEWIRSKDARLFKHLLLEPLGRASRADLCALFWPQHDRQQAGQNLRTSCSNIRTALRRALPESCIDLYFRSDRREIVLARELAVTDLARFLKLVGEARDAMSAQRIDLAMELYGAARALYRGPLLLDPSTESSAAVAREVDEAWNEIQRHLVALRRIGAGLPTLYRVA